METGLRRLVMEVLRDNVLSQEFNELLVETGISLDSPDWEVTNKMLERADEILLSLGGKKDWLH